jgi:hypothetical protein
MVAVYSEKLTGRGNDADFVTLTMTNVSISCVTSVVTSVAMLEDTISIERYGAIFHDTINGLGMFKTGGIQYRWTPSMAPSSVLMNNSVMNRIRNAPILRFQPARYSTPTLYVTILHSIFKHVYMSGALGGGLVANTVKQLTIRDTIFEDGTARTGTLSFDSHFLCMSLLPADTDTCTPHYHCSNQRKTGAAITMALVSQINLTHIIIRRNEGEGHALVVEDSHYFNIDVDTCHIECNTNQNAVMYNGLSGYGGLPPSFPPDRLWQCELGQLLSPSLLFFSILIHLR